MRIKFLAFSTHSVIPRYVADITSGVKLPCSICSILSLYSFFFSLSFTSYVFEGSWFTYRLAVGLKTLNIKNAIWPACQKLLAHMYNLASLPVIVEGCRISQVSSCNWCSTRMSLQTSFNNVAVVFLRWLWRSKIKPPFLQKRACWMSYFVRHFQLVGNLVRIHRYLIRMRSQKSCFVGS